MNVMTSAMSTAIENMYSLHVGIVGQASDRHERPHKPVMLLAVLDLIASGQASPDHVPWSQQLRSQFALYFKRVRRLDDRCTPEYPFLHLQSEGWWHPLRLALPEERPLNATPTTGDAESGLIFARITGPLAAAMIQPADRLCMREAVLDRYFPQARAELRALFVEEAASVPEPDIADGPGDDAKARLGRSAGFRRKILEIYDCQCAACGLRIKLPQIDDLTFVDAAHLIPFEISGNDHPTNGIALCKNHHWAMDRFLIAPSPEGIWEASTILEPRRSKGEEELSGLKGKKVLAANDAAFFPAVEALRWRMERLKTARAA